MLTKFDNFVKNDESGNISLLQLPIKDKKILHFIVTMTFGFNSFWYSWKYIFMNIFFHNISQETKIKIRKYVKYVITL